VFGRFFAPKSSILPTPPKNHIEVVCPACGAAQYEPRLVVSTFCKKCGAHLSIQKRRVTASNVSRSGAGYQDWTGAAPKPEVQPAPTPGKKPPVAEEPSPVLPEPVSEEDRKSDLSAADGFGAFLKAQVQPAEAEPPAEEVLEAFEAEAVHVEEPVTGSLRRPSSNSPAPTPAPAPMNASSIQKMKDLGMYRNQYFKDAECFDCGHKFKTSRSARSANCPTCGAYISLEDVEINMNATQPVKTRGDVIIRKRGHLSSSSLQCRDLRCFGTLEANVECGGDAIFRATGTVIGEIRCRRFIVEKGSDLVFKNPVHAEEVEIHARTTGAIFSSGPVLIGGNGAVNGDVTARSVSIEPGGELNGAMNIVRSKPAAPPAAA
jgi:cytoskeletal protein CcmA (bactofilin family)/ribosomal protein S27E